MRDGSPVRRLQARRLTSAGFTLVELMTVVAITGILATIGVALVRGHMNVAKANRALAGISAIRAAEAAFRAENGTYLDCSGNTGKWYPTLAEPGKTRYDWRQPDHQDAAKWAALPVANTTPTQYGFLVNAGVPGPVAPLLFTSVKPTFPASPDPWYVIQVKGDIDGNGVAMLGIATSFGDIYLEREGE